MDQLLLAGRASNVRMGYKSTHLPLLLFLCSCCVLQNAMLKIAQMNNWFITSTNIMNLSQKFTQAVWGKHADLLQLPNFSEGKIIYSCMQVIDFSCVVNGAGSPALHVVVLA